MLFLRTLWGKLTGRPPGGFSLGDKVSWGGCVGTVISVSSGIGGAPLQVLFAGPKLVVGFLLDGRFLAWHKRSDLKFLGRQSGRPKPRDPQHPAGVQPVVQPSASDDHPDHTVGEAGGEGQGPV